MPHKLLTNGPTRGSRPKIHTGTYKPKTLQITVKLTTSTETTLPPLKSQCLTGQLLADKVIPWRLKLQELFFLFPKRSCSCFARELGGKGGLQHLHSWSVGQRKQSLPRRGRHWTAAQSENNDVGHKHTQNEIHYMALCANKTIRALLRQTFIFKLAPFTM